MSKPSYSTQNNGDCEICSLSNYGRDCRNIPFKEGGRHGSASATIVFMVKKIDGQIKKRKVYRRLKGENYLSILELRKINKILTRKLIYA